MISFNIAENMLFLKIATESIKYKSQKSMDVHKKYINWAAIIKGMWESYNQVSDNTFFFF